LQNLSVVLIGLANFNCFNLSEMYAKNVQQKKISE